MSREKDKFQLFQRLENLGFTYEEARQLRRIEMTLHRWAELECGVEGANPQWTLCVERDEKTNRPMMRRMGPGYGGQYVDRSWPIADREAGALRRLKAIVYARNRREPSGFIIPYHQTDPRGCALYLVKAEDLQGNRIVEAAQRLGFAWEIKDPMSAKGPATYQSPQLPGRVFGFPEQGAIWFLKDKGQPIPPSRNLPIDAHYTRGLAVCA